MRPTRDDSKLDDNARVQRGAFLFNPEADAEEMRPGDGQSEAAGPTAVVTPWPTMVDGAYYGIRRPCWCICWSPSVVPLAAVRDW